VPLVRFTANIQRHVPCPTESAEGSTVRAVMEAYFSRHERVRGYVVDDGGHLRPHLVIFVDGRPVTDRQGLTDVVGASSTIDVFQALSGG